MTQCSYSWVSYSSSLFVCCLSVDILSYQPQIILPLLFISSALQFTHHNIISTVSLLKLLWSLFSSVFTAHMHKAVVIVAGCSAQLIMHYHWVCYCNFFSLLLRFLAISDKISKLITVITFMSLCSLSMRLNKSFIVMLMLHWSSL